MKRDEKFNLINELSMAVTNKTVFEHELGDGRIEYVANTNTLRVNEQAALALNANNHPEKKQKQKKKSLQKSMPNEKQINNKTKKRISKIRIEILFNMKVQFNCTVILLYYSEIAPTGQTPAHVPQLMHEFSSISYCPDPSAIAFTGHSPAHVPQLIHESLITNAINISSFKSVCIMQAILNLSQNRLYL